MYKAGDILGGCRILLECGSGAFGSVFLAENEATHQRVALKILPKTGRHHERELAALTVYQEKCRHANLMRIYHIGRTEDCLFYTMDAADPLNHDGDYVPDTLGNRLRQRRRLTPEEIRTMLHELLDGLEILHGAGLLHRDIKPDNVLWVDGHAVLGDIGLVTEAEKASFAGTRGFISPAVWKGERRYSAQDDLYALAMTLYCALTGNEPKGNLELPLSLTFSGCADLIRAYNAVLDEESSVRSVADFRAALLKRRNLLSKKRRNKILPAILITVLCTLLAVFIYDKFELLNDYPVQNRDAEVPNFMKFKSKIKNAPVQKITRNQETSPQPRKTPPIPQTPERETPAKPESGEVRSAPAEVSVRPQEIPSVLELPSGEPPMPQVAEGKAPHAVDPTPCTRVKPHPVQAMKMPGAAAERLPLGEKSAVSGKDDDRKTARLAEALEREWRDSCRERLKKAGEVVVLPINIEQGENARLSYAERKSRAQEKSILRETQVRRMIEEEEEYQLPNLKSFAEIAIRYFGDAAYNDDLIKKNKELLRDFDNPEFLLDYYGDILCTRASFGLPMLWSGKLAELDKRLKSLPPEERRMRLRSIVFAALRRNYFNGEILMKSGGFPVRSFPQREEVEQRLSFFDQYIDRF